MPIIKSAKKALRQSRKRIVQNKKKKLALSFIVEKVKKQKEAGSLNTAYSMLDKMVKSKIIHKNKADRLKSQLAKIIGKSVPSKKQVTKTPAVKAPTVKKTTAKPKTASKLKKAAPAKKKD